MAQDRVRVRMYRQGLGDCFLVTIPGEKGRPFHLMIDCGVILGTPDAEARLRAVIGSVIEETGGQVDVLAVTHEHYDHVAGFVLAPDLFASPAEAGAAGKLSVGEVWFAWTEDPADPLATRLRAERARQLRALHAIALRLGAEADAELDPALGAALAFFGVTPKDKDKDLGATARAMRAARGFAPPERVRYLRPGAVLTPVPRKTEPGKAELKIRVLGPPMDPKLLRRTDSTSEVYQIDAQALEASVRLAAGAGADEEEEGDAPAPVATSPFGPGWGVPLARLGQRREEIWEDLAARYLGPDAEGGDPSWRRVDGAWSAGAAGLALALDGATNNTSLVLAIELPSRRVLLFAADAQVGNWLSWQDLTWPGEPGGPLSARDLLGRVAFYKVGHHGSHNATLRALGLELMPGADLTSFIPVDQEMARKKRWTRMPLPALVEALEARGPVVRLDAPLPARAASVKPGGAGLAYESLYFDWTIALDGG